MRFDGKLTSWNDERGFGFIQPLQGGQEIFVHIKAFPDGTGRPVVGLPLSFEVEPGPQGKKRARSVQFAHSKARGPRPEAPAPWTLPRLLVIPAFVGLYFAIGSRWPVSPWVAAVYVAASIAAFLAYAFDKTAARQGEFRTREKTLHAFGLACGWPGALLAQQLLRHKTTKSSFIFDFWTTIVINVAVFVALHSPPGRRLLAAVSGVL